MDKKIETNDNYRHTIQIFWAFITNSFIIGFIQGKIYQGNIKHVCIPGLNCYSCPGAVASCPIGSLQGGIGSYEFKFSYYIAGFMIFIGVIMGRYVCGWLCPFGLFQDLLYKIPFIKKINTFKGDKSLRKTKYVILVIFVILIPLFVVDIIGQGSPAFCKLICPAGTLEGGIPLVLTNEGLRLTVGWLFAWKILLLAVTIIASVIIYRPFCKYICPLGAIYSLFNPISVFKYRINSEKCIHCHACADVCKMNCDPVKNANDLECIRCGLCKSICPTNAIEYTYFNNKNNKNNKNI